LVKQSGDDSDRVSPQERELAIKQLVSRAVVSTDIIDIMEAAGIGRPDISILSDGFLQEVREMPQRNLAIEALRKLLEGQIRSRSRSNLTEAEAFSARLEQAVGRYHSNALTSVQILDELIRLAQEMAAARARGEELGLTPEEVAFYDALACNESARDAMGDGVTRDCGCPGQDNPGKCDRRLECYGPDTGQNAHGRQTPATKIRLPARYAG